MPDDWVKRCNKLEGKTCRGRYKKTWFERVKTDMKDFGVMCG